jgi:hypothetical protein
MPEDAVLRWLLDGDPAIRWQALRDLVGAAQSTVERERRRVAREGWGARLLALQDPAGTWADALYSPKWISTTYTMLLLRDFGLPPNNVQAGKACQILLDRGFMPDGGINYAKSRQISEACVTGMILSLLSCFEGQDERLDTLAEHLLAQQMPDGGWNCLRPEGATHSSMHTTISVLEGLRHYELLGRRKAASARAAQRRGREFLQQHRLFRSHRTGQIIHPMFLRCSFPPRWHYDILRALDYFRAVDSARDERLAEAVQVLRDKQKPGGRWKLENLYAGRVWFELEHRGAPSRWNTLRAIRVLRWWDGISHKKANCT